MIALLLLAAAHQSAEAKAPGDRSEVRTCLVVGVSDGDTLTARCGQPGQYEQIRVRVSGIDAPERRQPYGERAKQALSGLTFQRWAQLDCPKTDRYGRSVCTVWVTPASMPNGPQTLDAGHAMVTLGLAWWYRAYAGEQTAEVREQYEFAETEARARRTGLWQEATPIAPWEWRKLQAVLRGDMSSLPGCMTIL